jgi:hypothetical protein
VDSDRVCPNGCEIHARYKGQEVTIDAPLVHDKEGDYFYCVKCEYCECKECTISK